MRLIQSQPSHAIQCTSSRAGRFRNLTPVACDTQLSQLQSARCRPQAVVQRVWGDALQLGKGCMVAAGAAAVMMFAAPEGMQERELHSASINTGYRNGDGDFVCPTCCSCSSAAGNMQAYQGHQICIGQDSISVKITRTKCSVHAAPSAAHGLQAWPPRRWPSLQQADSSLRTKWMSFPCRTTR